MRDDHPSSLDSFSAVLGPVWLDVFGADRLAAPPGHVDPTLSPDKPSFQET